jgi:hypothetical protein
LSLALSAATSESVGLKSRIQELESKLIEMETSKSSGNNKSNQLQLAIVTDNVITDTLDDNHKFQLSP